MLQTLIIGSVMLVSKVIEILLPFSFPSAVIGLVLMFGCLCMGIIQLEQIETVGNALVDNIGLFFVPAGVSTIKSLAIIEENPWGNVGIIVLSTLILLAVTGLCTQLMMKVTQFKERYKR